MTWAIFVIPLVVMWGIWWAWWSVFTFLALPLWMTYVVIRGIVRYVRGHGDVH